jgi:virginiamycin B lyase
MKIRLLLIIIIIMTAAMASLLVAATTDVAILEWDVPTPNSFPHDPAASQDGTLWYTGIMSNTIGQLDPETGKIKEYKLKHPASGPHGLVIDGAGHVWFTANYKGYIGKLNPQTGEVIEYPMPDQTASDPHSLVIDHDSMVWFTVQRGNFVGRLDSRTGRIELMRSPTPESLPYGLALNSKQVPFFCEFGNNKIAKIDPLTMKITEYELPKGSRPRRLTITADDAVYYTDYARGKVGRLLPDSRKVEEWPSPGGPKSKPYGITSAPDGIVWYSESGVVPNTVVRFNPKTKVFTSWPIPSGGGVIRNMVSTPKGDIFIACSGKNKIGIINIRR